MLYRSQDGDVSRKMSKVIDEVKPDIKKSNKRKSKLKLVKRYFKKWKAHIESSEGHRKSKREAIAMARMKLQTVESFMESIRSELEEDIKVVGDYYKQKFVRAALDIILINR